MKKHIKILLVDSSPLQASFKSWLEQEGYSVVTANDGVKALNYLKDNSVLPDIILSDTVIPNMDGFELCSKACKLYPDIPFVMLTIHNDEKNIKKAFNSGAVEYLGKPFSKTELLIRVSSVLKRHKKEKFLSQKIRSLYSDQTELLVHNKKFENFQVESAKTEETFKKVFNNANDAMLIIYGNSFLDCNEAAVKLLDAESTKDVLACHPSELSPTIQPDGRDSYEKANEMIKIAFEKGFHRFEWMHKKITGDFFPVEVSLTPIGYKNELMLHTLWKDLTLQKKNEEKLEKANQKIVQSNEELEKANQIILKKAKAKGDFLATMSHEIRTPLNAIMGSARLLRESKSSEEIKQYTDMIETSGNFLLGIINNVLDYSRIEAHKLKILSSQFCLKNIIKNIQKILTKTAESKKLIFEVQTNNDLSQELTGDDIRLQQIILNLCNNAIKYTKIGHVILKIEICNETTSIIKYKFSTIDTGIGISKENIKNLFKPFTKFDSEINKDVEGSGLGLSIVKSTLDLMGGKMGVESEVGAGSTFWFELQFQKEAVNKTEKRINASGRKRFSSIKNNLKILITDDYKFSRIILENNLKKSGIQSIDTAENGQEAVTLCKNNNYDIIFMDCIMPVLNGFEATKEIRKIKMTEKYTNIIALSADVMTENKNVCLNAGMDYFMPKPFSPEKINDTIRKIILKNDLEASDSR